MSAGSEDNSGGCAISRQWQSSTVCAWIIRMTP